jgi:PKD repeat protein
MNFTNQSVGSNLSYSWEFGDPSSAPDDTSSLLNPYHLYSAAGNYLVTLIISDGAQSDTAYNTVTVPASCMSVSVSYNLNTCFGDTTFYYYNLTGVTSANWDFGDPASGADNYSASFTPWHIFTSPGVFIGSLMYTNGVDTDTAVVYTYVVDCSVWPGDVNRDGEVSGEDILAIGLSYGDTGTVRAGASINFTSQPTTDWHPGQIFLAMYLNDMVNKKHADCNGDGIINAADVQAVTQNFGSVHYRRNNLSSMQLVSPSAPHLSITAPATITSGNSASISLRLGDISIPATGIYGYCVTIAYDITAIASSSINVGFTNSWLDTVSGQPNLLNWYHNDEVNRLLTIVSVRTDQNSVTGFGELANISFNTIPGNSGNMNFHIREDAKVMSSTVYGNAGNGNVQNFIRVNTDDASVNIVLGINENPLPEWLTVYPSPASDVIHISLLRDTKVDVKLYDMTGRLVESSSMSEKNNLLDVSRLSTGIYHLSISAEEKNYDVRIIIEK